MKSLFFFAVRLSLIETQFSFYQAILKYLFSQSYLAQIIFTTDLYQHCLGVINNYHRVIQINFIFHRNHSINLCDQLKVNYTTRTKPTKKTKYMLCHKKKKIAAIPELIYNFICLIFQIKFFFLLKLFLLHTYFSFTFTMLLHQYNNPIKKKPNSLQDIILISKKAPLMNQHFFLEKKLENNKKSETRPKDELQSNHSRKLPAIKQIPLMEGQNDFNKFLKGKHQTNVVSISKTAFSTTKFSSLPTNKEHQAKEKLHNTSLRFTKKQKFDESNNILSAKISEISLQKKNSEITLKINESIGQINWSKFSEHLFDNHVLEEKGVENILKPLTKEISISTNIVLFLKSPYKNRPPVIYFHNNTNPSRLYDLNLYYVERKNLSKRVPKVKLPDSKMWPVVIEVLLACGMKHTEKNEYLLYWGRPLEEKDFRALKKNQKVNHFHNQWEIGRKDNLWKNLKQKIIKFPQLFDFVPKTYILELDYEEFEKERNTLKEQKLDCWWILKPVDAGRGEGIRLLKNNEKLNVTQGFLASKYIKNIHLIEGKKYDLRVYVLITSLDPLVIYVYKEGLVRIASKQYSKNITTHNDKFIHLTNYSINKNNSEIKDDAELKWDFTTYKTYLKDNGVDPELLFEGIEQLIFKSIIGCYDNLINMFNTLRTRNFNSFQLFGFDILIDDKFKPWLLEVNVDPSLRAGAEIDKRIKRALIADIFTLVGLKLNNLNSVKDGNLAFLSSGKDTNSVQLQDFENMTIDKFEILLEVEEQFSRKGNFSIVYPDKKKEEFFNQVVKKSTKNNKSILQYFHFQGEKSPLFYVA